MPVNTNLNTPPYFDDFDFSKQYYRVLFKPGYAVQARELTQLQSSLQNQIEQFGEHIFQEGSIVKGVNFTELTNLEYVKLADKIGFDVASFVGGPTETGEIYYELEGQVTGLRASIVAATRGFESRAPDLNTFYINYLNTNVAQQKVFLAGEELKVFRIIVTGGTITSTVEVNTINVTTRPLPVGLSYAVRSGEGVLFQRGHFLFAEEQLVIVSKYNNTPDAVSIGFRVDESIINAFQDSSLFDNANGSPNENAPGADRLKLTPVLVAIPTVEADADSDFFTLIRYVNGRAVQIRDVAQYNVIGEEFARRTFEESGDYIVEKFDTKVVLRDGDLKASVGPGIAYVKGYRVENKGEIFLDIDPVTATATRVNQPVSFNYGGYVDITTLAGNVAFGSYQTVNLQNAGLTTIGTARVKNITPTRLYLFEVDMNPSQNFSSVTRIVGSSGSITINNVLKDTVSTGLVFPTGMFALQDTDNISLPVRTSRAVTGIANTFTINADVGEDFFVQQNDILLVDSANVRINILSTSVNVSGTVMTINLVLGQTPTANGTLYFNKRIQAAEPYAKNIANVYVRSSFTPATTKYNLGFPDVFRVLEIIDIAGNNVTDSFRLKRNQKDDYYDHSYIEYIPGRTVPATGLMTIRLETFQLNTTTGSYFFTVQSYPVTIGADQIPSYTTTAGATYNLRDCIDMRPYVTALGSYTATTSGAAPTIAPAIDLTPVFSGTLLIPANNAFAEVDYDYYLNRTDSVIIDSYGRFRLVKGEEKEKSVPVRVDAALKIADIYIPGFPATTPEIAARENRPQYATRVVSRGVRNYTMKDIADIDAKVEQLRYYTVLNALESQTKNLNILDANGLTRFKNGIIVDPFNDLSIADVGNSEFSAAIDASEKSITPSVVTFPMNLKLESSTNASVFGDGVVDKIATLGRNAHVAIISQDFATNFRNCVSNFYFYRGTGQLSPEFDYGYDVVTNPVQIQLDLATPLLEFADALNEFVPLTSVNSTSSAVRQQTGNTITTTTTIQDTIRSLQVNATENVQEVGDFVTDVSFNPYIRPREVSVYMSGLRPNTRHYFFFDEENVDEFVAPGSTENITSAIRRAGAFGAAVIADANGIVRAVFNIPANRFFVGERTLYVADVSTYPDIESASTSRGFLRYNAYNMSLSKSALTVSTRIPEVDFETTTTNRTVTNRTVIPTFNFGTGGSAEARRNGFDPIAQTFFIKESMAGGSNALFASKVDVFFKRKSAVNGVTVMLREVVNGYPSAAILPFSKVHFLPSQVNISEDGSVATEVFFEAPVRLDTEKEYALVVMPDANDPDYLIYTSKVGGVNLVNGEAVTQDWGDGVLFTSTNNRAWQSYQDEDVKFTLYRHNFNSATGSVTLTYEDHEFLSITNSTGLFKSGEVVYTEKALSGSTGTNISVTTGSKTLTGTALTDTYAVGDHVIVKNGANKTIFKVVTVTATTIVADRPAVFTGSFIALPVVVGTLVYYNYRNPVDMILEASSALPTRNFAATNIVYGIDSGAFATIATVDDIELSYLQPMISKTTDIVSSVSMSGVFTDPDNPGVTYTKEMQFGDSAYFNTRGVLLRSRSNGGSTFRIIVNMANNATNTVSPVVDIETAMIFAYQYKVPAKYVSKIVELAENFEAEDFRLYVTGYRPTGTNIRAFVKVQNSVDPTLFENNSWIELSMIEGTGVFSSTANLDDFREFVYEIPASVKASGVVRYTNGSGIFDGYRKFAIKIEMEADEIRSVPRLLDYRGIALT